MRVPMRFSRSFLSVAVGVAVIVAGLGVAYAASANQFTSGFTDKSVYKFGNNIYITGTVNGDIYCAGQTVNIDAKVNGDVICAGQNVTVGGNVNGDIRLAGQTININGVVANNVSVAGQDISFSQNAKIGRDISVAGQTISIDGPVGRDAEIAGETVYVNSSIGRNASVRVSKKLILQDKAVIGRNLSYTSPQILVKTGPAKVNGQTTFTKLEQKGSKKTWQTVWRIYVLAAMTLFAVILVALFPQLFRRWNEVAVKKLGWVFLVGVIGAIAMPILIGVAFATIVGAPVGILLLLLWIIAFMLSFPLAIYFLGHSIFSKMHPVLMVLIAALLIGIFQLIPILGGLISLLAYLLGTGILLINLKNAYKKPDYSRK
jgi:hypothetical protein